MTTMTIQPFQVLERSQNIHSSYVLEASAGTGKTYSIENIVVRLLIDENTPCTLENILVVTFTKAATADLKSRIRQSIQYALAILYSCQIDDAPDYLIALLEQEESSQLYAKRQLENALACFEQAPVFTIHGFCHRMLKEYVFEADVSASIGEGDAEKEKGIPPSLYTRLIRDFFRTGLSEDLVSYGQLKILINHCKGLEGLEKELYHLMTKGIAIAQVPTLHEHLQKFCIGMASLKHDLRPIPQRIMDDFLVQAPSFNGICNLQKKPKEEHVAKIEKFAALFDKDSWDLADFDILIADGLYFAEALAPSNLGKKKLLPSSDLLFYPEMIPMLTTALAPCVKKARNPDFILAVIAFKCKELVQAYLTRKEIIGFDDLLTCMDRAVQNPLFAAKVRQRFTTAIIDEFQDTDPVQWKIFKTIFLPEDHNHTPGRLYLVGDPKQSIYGFRQADIYTYIAAGNALGDQCRASLETNYRSTEPLVNALNLLFSSEVAPGLIALPHLQETLPYRPVKSGGKVAVKFFDDNRGVIHFFAPHGNGSQTKKLAEAEECYFLPFITHEIQLLQAQGVTLSNSAVLVADRFQAARLGVHLRRMEIPFVVQRAESLVETLAFGAMKELLQAIINPQKESSLKIALAGPFLGWSQQEMLTLTDPYALEALIAKGLILRRIWRDHGFSAFYNAFLVSSWVSSGETVGESLLLREGGLDLYHGMQQIAEFLIEKEMAERLPPVRLIRTLDDLIQSEEDGDQCVKQRSNPEKEGVRILTIHSSKGLEFEIVFALGVIRRARKPSVFIPIIQDYLPPLLTPVENEEDPRYVKYLLELDAEKIRQLYVAFTRAKQRLYIPFFIEGSGKACEPGVASPMELYLAMMGQPQIPFEELYARIPLLNSETSFEMIRKLRKEFAITLSGPDEIQKWVKGNSLLSVESELILRGVQLAVIPGAPYYMHSFTALSKRSSQTQHTQSVVPVFGDVRPPSDYNFSDKSAHTLPAGSSTGTLLHTLLELIPFNLASYGKRSIQLLAFVDKNIARTSFKVWREVIADILYDALTAPLSIGATSFSLNDLSDDRCYREHEFLYAATQSFHSEFEDRPGFLKGVIDLIFEFDGKFCILDWKSNWLGPDESHYSESSMQQAMRNHDYHLQARIYKEALERYLKLIDGRPFEELFGGVFYVFLRGLNAEGAGGITRLDNLKYENVLCV
ncbi:MAG: UvrD-helicase domain-containing protein [Parachlamydiaceae bacterium]|nr:UvrD-helicase domain-containing protein [Parachlamydiaceae bacterium]